MRWVGHVAGSCALWFAVAVSTPTYGMDMCLQESKFALPSPAGILCIVIVLLHGIWQIEFILALKIGRFLC